MLSCEQYRSRFYNYQIMKDYLDGKITPWEFREKYIHQRHKDLNVIVFGFLTWFTYPPR